MRTFKVIDKTFVKSNNSTYNIMARYTYSLIIFIILTMIINIIMGNRSIVLDLFKTITLSMFFSSVIAYIINIIKKKYSYIKIYKEENTIFIALVIALCGYNINIYVLFIAILVCFIIKNIFKNIGNSCVLYGILIIIVYRYIGNISDLFMINSNYNMTSEEVKEAKILTLLFDIKNLVPMLSFGSLIYLFYKKGIKYNIVFSYLGTFAFMMLLIGLLNGKIWLVLMELINCNILFLGIYVLSDYKISPTISNGQVIYGIILGYLSVILRFIMPELSIILPMIIGMLFINKPLDKISYKFKYNDRLYYMCLIIALIVILITGFII